MGRLDGKVCVITGDERDRRRDRAAVRRRGCARVAGVDLAEGAEGELALQADVADEDSVREMYTKVAEEMGESTSSSTTPASAPTTTFPCSTHRSRRGSASRT